MDRVGLALDREQYVCLLELLAQLGNKPAAAPPPADLVFYEAASLADRNVYVSLYKRTFDGYPKMSDDEEKTLQVSCSTRPAPHRTRLRRCFRGCARVALGAEAELHRRRTVPDLGHDGMLDMGRGRCCPCCWLVPHVMQWICVQSLSSIQ